MQFPYQEYPRVPSEAFPDLTVRLVPMIPVILSAGKKPIQIDALVDSGADSCIFPGMLGVALGIDVHKGPIQRISGLGGRIIEARFHNIQLKLGKIDCKIYAGFSFDTIGITGLLGQRGFFENFRVTFDRQNRCVIIHPKNIFNNLFARAGI